MQIKHRCLSFDVSAQQTIRSGRYHFRTTSGILLFEIYELFCEVKLPLMCCKYNPSGVCYSTRMYTTACAEHEQTITF